MILWLFPKNRNYDHEFQVASLMIVNKGIE